MQIDGGPAFPTQETDEYVSHDGMKLLDYFAAHAITKVMWNRLECTFAESAKHAYEIAQAMIAERKRIIEPEPTELVHRMAPHQPFVAICGADVLNQRTTDFQANVTCDVCKSKMKPMTSAEMIEETMDRR